MWSPETAHRQHLQRQPTYCLRGLHDNRKTAHPFFRHSPLVFFSPLVAYPKVLRSSMQKGYRSVANSALNPFHMSPRGTRSPKKERFEGFKTTNDYNSSFADTDVPRRWLDRTLPDFFPRPPPSHSPTPAWSGGDSGFVAGATLRFGCRRVESSKPTGGEDATSWTRIQR